MLLTSWRGRQTCHVIGEKMQEQSSLCKQHCVGFFSPLKMWFQCHFPDFLIRNKENCTRAITTDSQHHVVQACTALVTCPSQKDKYCFTATLPTAASPPLAWLILVQKKPKKTVSEEKEDKKKHVNKQPGR